MSSVRLVHVGHLSDIHLQEGERFEETVAALGWAVVDMRQRGVELVIITGDVFDHLGRPSTPTEREALADALAAFCQLGPVYIIKGNHDQPLDLALFSRLPGVTVDERPRLHRVVLGQGAGERWLDLYALPYPDLWSFGGTREAANMALRTILAAVSPIPNVPLLLAAHLNVAGSVSSTGQPLIGSEPEFALGDLLDTGAAAVLLGHIHKHQALASTVVYAGSLVAHDYGETEDKGYVLWSFDGLFAGWNFVPTFAPKRLSLDYRIDATGLLTLDGAGVADVADLVRGHHVRLRYRIPEELAVQFHAGDYFRSLLPGIGHARSLKFEGIIERRQAVRGTAVAEAVTLEAKLEAWMADQKLEQQERGRLRSLLEQAQTAARTFEAAEGNGGS